MKTSATNLLIDVTIGAASSSMEIAGKEAANILDNDILKVYAAIGNFDITIFNVGGITFDFIALMNVYFDSGLTIQLYNSALALIYSESFTSTDWSGFELKNIYMAISATITDINQIRIFSTGGDNYTEKWCGYIWGGLHLDFGCIEAGKPKSVSNDNIQISRTDHPDVNESYLYRGLDLTIKKESDFKDTRAMVEQVLTDGYGRGRPWYFDDNLFENELLYANMDSGKVEFNVFPFSSKTGKKFSTQFTIGLREVT
jgi:hypothetical protein